VEFWGGLLGFVGADGLGFGEGVETEIAAGLGPLVVLLGEDSAHEADDRVPVGEDPNNVRATADLPVESLVRVVRPDLPPELLREDGEGEDVCAGSIEVGERFRQFVFQRVEDPVELGVHRPGIGLVVNGVQECFHLRPGTLRDGAHQVCRVVGAAALPGRSGQGCRGRSDQAGVGVSR